MTRILSIDGGGIRGIIPAVWLAALQQRLKRPLHTYFDIIVGTSTGAALACAVSAGFDPESYKDMYLKYGRKVFPGTCKRLGSRFKRTFTQGFSAPKYSDEGLKKVLKEVFGNMEMGELKKVVLITSYNTEDRSAVIFKSIKNEHFLLPVWKVCKASMSAPTYFPAEMVKGLPHIDGGVVENAPVICGVAEALKLGSKLDDLVVCSLGTGDPHESISAKSAREWGALEWARPLVGVVTDGSQESNHYIAKRLLQPDNYFRLQTRVSRTDLDDASQRNMDNLQVAAQIYLKAGGDAYLDALAAKLQKK